jgi:hypothetical protein
VATGNMARGQAGAVCEFCDTSQPPSPCLVGEGDQFHNYGLVRSDSIIRHVSSFDKKIGMLGLGLHHANLQV